MARADTDPIESGARAFLRFFEAFEPVFFGFLERALITSALWWAATAADSQVLRVLAASASAILVFWSTRAVLRLLPDDWTEVSNSHGRLRVVVVNVLMVVVAALLLVAMGRVVGEAIDGLATLNDPPQLRGPVG